MLTKEEIKQIAAEVAARIAETDICTKAVLTIEEAAKYMGVSKSYLYKLTMSRGIPHTKPTGGKCYFNRVELEEWLKANPVMVQADIIEAANNYCSTKKANI